MIKVIKKEPAPSAIREVVCRNCGATLQYMNADVQERTVRDYTGDSDQYRWIVCPECKAEVTHTPK